MRLRYLQAKTTRLLSLSSSSRTRAQSIEHSSLSVGISGDCAGRTRGDRASDQASGPQARELRTGAMFRSRTRRAIMATVENAIESAQ